jgi:hypothetical protein
VIFADGSEDETDGEFSDGMGRIGGNVGDFETQQIGLLQIDVVCARTLAPVIRKGLKHLKSGREPTHTRRDMNFTPSS